jgi:hypothetical protein
MPLAERAAVRAPWTRINLNSLKDQIELILRPFLPITPDIRNRFPVRCHDLIATGLDHGQGTAIPQSWRSIILVDPAIRAITDDPQNLAFRNTQFQVRDGVHAP